MNKTALFFRWELLLLLVLVLILFSACQVEEELNRADLIDGKITETEVFTATENDITISLYKIDPHGNVQQTGGSARGPQMLQETGKLFEILAVIDPSSEYRIADRELLEQLFKADLRFSENSMDRAAELFAGHVTEELGLERIPLEELEADGERRVFRIEVLDADLLSSHQYKG